MTAGTKVYIASIVAVVAGLVAAVTVRAAGDKVAFPQNYAAGVLHWVQDRRPTSRSASTTRARRPSTPQRPARRFRTAP